MIAESIRQADESLRSFHDKSVKSACYAPFVSLYLTPMGTVQACCRNQNYLLGDLKKQRLTEIWNGAKIGALRTALAAYNFGLGCAYCEWESQRRWDSFAIRLMSDAYPVRSAHPEWPAMIEFKASNTCNLECIQCCGEFSSAIRANRDGLPPLQKVYDDRFFEDLRAFLPHLQFVNFLGGEPFLAAESHRAWDMMIADGLTIPCRVTTNGTRFDARVERVLDKLPMSVTVSLDGVTKQTYETVRKRGNFEQVLANLHRFHGYTRERGTAFGISYCLMRQNWQEVGEIALLAEHLDCELSILMVLGPANCTLFTLPPHEFREVVESIERIGETIAPKLRRHAKAWQETVVHLREALAPNQSQKIKTFLFWDIGPETPIAQAADLVDRSDHGGALRKLEEVPQEHFNFYYRLALAGDVRRRQGDFEGAEKDLEYALQMSRKLPNAYLNLARLRFRQGRMDEALENALLAKERVIAEDPVEAQVLTLLGVVQVSMGRLLGAYQALARLATLPAVSTDGEGLLDSTNGARKIVTDLRGTDRGPRARSIAFVVQLLYRAARTVNRADVMISKARQRSGLKQARPAPPPSQIHTLMAFSPGPRWSLRVAGVDNRARLAQPAHDSDSVRVAIENAGSRVGYDIQVNYARVTIRAQSSYRLRFRVRADGPRAVPFGIAKANAPWSNLGFYRSIDVDTSWREVDEIFESSDDEDNARVHFDLGESGVPIEIASLALTRVQT